MPRDDDLDKSDEDDDDGMRVNFSINKAARERQQIRDDFMAAEHGECCHAAVSKFVMRNRDV